MGRVTVGYGAEPVGWYRYYSRVWVATFERLIIRDSVCRVSQGTESHEHVVAEEKERELIESLYPF